MRITKRQLIELIKESTIIDHTFGKSLAQSAANSKFWKYPHGLDDVDLVDEWEDGTTFTTPAIDILSDSLNSASERMGKDIQFIISVSYEPQYALGPDDPHGSYPNKWLMRGQYRGPVNNKHIIWLEFRPLAENYNMQDLDLYTMIRSISRTINHELVHYQQLKKQAASKGISEEAAWEEMLCDTNQVPISDAETYKKRCGKEPNKKAGKGRSEYLSRHVEIDAYAHEAAEELLDKYGLDSALDIIRHYERPEATPVIKDYVYWLQKQHRQPALQNFMSKVYTQLINLSSLK